MLKKKNTNFYNNKISKEGSQCICLSLVLINFSLEQANFYPQVVLEECKYVDKQKKIPEYITDEIEIQLVEKLSEYRKNYNITYKYLLVCFVDFLRMLG